MGTKHEFGFHEKKTEKSKKHTTLVRSRNSILTKSYFATCHVCTMAPTPSLTHSLTHEHLTHSLTHLFSLTHARTHSPTTALSANRHYSVLLLFWPRRVWTRHERALSHTAATVALYTYIMFVAQAFEPSVSSTVGPRGHTANTDRGFAVSHHTIKELGNFSCLRGDQRCEPEDSNTVFFPNIATNHQRTYFFRRSKAPVDGECSACRMPVRLRATSSSAKLSIRSDIIN